MPTVEAPLEYDTIDGVLAPAQTLHLYGHESFRTTFEQMRKEQRLHHALLFEGPKGIGKATLAFQLAWNILTDQPGPLRDPDPQSVDWRQIVQKSHPRILHISRPLDIKTERFRAMITVEEIRNIMRLTGQTSSNGGWRVVIIDAADDMNRNAANALLKTLEEPPSKVLFILISHYAGRLLPTIRSRCQSHLFFPLERKNLETALSAATNHIFNPSSTDASFILDKAEGSVRNAALLMNYGGLDIMRAVDEILNAPNLIPQKVQALAQALSGRDTIIQYQQFCDDYLMRIANLARQHAEEGHHTASSDFAQMWRDVAKEIGETEAYNLDRKQFVITLLHRLHKITHNHVK